MIALNVAEARLIKESIEQALPYLEVGLHEGDVDEEVIEELQASYDIVNKLLEGF